MCKHTRLLLFGGRVNKKTSFNDIIDVFLMSCAEAEGLTEDVEIEEYIKERKERIEDCIIKKDAK
jgi:hypothetical protein